MAFELNDAAPKVLISDDDPYAVKALVERCRRMGLEVEPAASGRSLLVRAGQREQPSLPAAELEDLWPHLLDRQRSSTHVAVIRGKSGSNAADAIDTLETSHILKGGKFWSHFDALLTKVFSLKKAVATMPAAKIVPVARPQVLLVDDDLDVRKFIFSGLRTMGIEPKFATDGIIGFWKARRNPPAVIVTDYFMPNGDAECLLAKLRSTPETRNIPLIVQSGRQLSDDVTRRLQGEVCGQPGASLVLRKSLGARELLGRLEIMCGLAKAPVLDRPTVG
jgi:CheY-like chemotaxis protein